jgi:hypothetical protein
MPWRGCPELTCILKPNRAALAAAWLVHTSFTPYFGVEKLQAPSAKLFGLIAQTISE